MLTLCSVSEVVNEIEKVKCVYLRGNVVISYNFFFHFQAVIRLTRGEREKSLQQSLSTCDISADIKKLKSAGCRELLLGSLSGEGETVDSHIIAYSHFFFKLKMKLAGFFVLIPAAIHKLLIHN